MSVRRFAVCIALVWGCLLVGFATAASPQEALARHLAPLTDVVSGRDKSFEIKVRLEIPVEGKQQTVTIRLNRIDEECFDLLVDHDQYAAHLHRRGDQTVFVVPNHNTSFRGTGEAPPTNHLRPEGFVTRTVGPGTSLSNYLLVLPSLTPKSLAALLTTGLHCRPQSPESNDTFLIDDVRLHFPEPGTIEVTRKNESVKLVIGAASPAVKLDDLQAEQVVELERTEIERQLARGARRTLEIFFPSSLLTQPAQKPRTVSHGELLWIDGARVARLEGTPEEIGRAHGELLQVEAHRCIDSVLYAFGTVQTISTGRWFRHDLEAAYARLKPHIPERHLQETRALAAAVGVEPEVAEALNVFPELFHCSGFAVFDSATADGTLYHGRVLDYMTMIGLQDAATTFIVSPDGHIPFANVGYAGFIGSVSGMNAQALSLGEMGGHGEGQWDGVPMATLMRRALEECKTLDEVKTLWAESPRTCEYYYVFADGKTNRAVGVAATPDAIEFVEPGESHPLLGEGIPDAVVLSAGDRLQALRARVREHHGQLDAQSACNLMCRPVAMKSNLHNVLFVPAQGILYVANASHDQPAAERPYVRLDLNALLNDAADVRSTVDAD